MDSLHKRLLRLQMRHWEQQITLSQANKLRECLHSLERHSFAKYVDEVAKRITKQRHNRHDLYTGATLQSRPFTNDDGREKFGFVDAFGKSHTISL